MDADTSMADTTSLIIYIVVSALLPVLLIIGSKLLSPKKPARRKKLSFESGQVPFGWTESSFPVEYFPYAIIYIAYAVIALAVFLSVVAVIDNPGAALNVVVLLAVLSASSIYAAATLKNLPQRL
ncbi:MAG: NADH-quinone oxidoreductase subunit A [Candidatus Caldarchaeum sp.]|jgi:NADH:ubiquinone oxidoreductase subunit 3 (subunit A)|uniref:NADH-quinone oxidoreductase subunit A n=2 Tax=Caldiarchaeum subterraneum TaxID=311458 RepID=A0A7C4DZY1_CALS0